MGNQMCTATDGRSPSHPNAKRTHSSPQSPQNPVTSPASPLVGATASSSSIGKPVAPTTSALNQYNNQQQQLNSNQRVVSHPTTATASGSISQPGRTSASPNLGGSVSQARTSVVSYGGNRGHSHEQDDEVLSEWTAKPSPDASSLANSTYALSSTAHSSVSPSANGTVSHLPTAEGDRQRRLDWIEDFGEGRSDQKLTLKQLQQATSSNKSTFATKAPPSTKYTPVAVKNTLPATIKAAGLSIDEKKTLVEYAFVAATTCPYSRRRRAQGTVTDDKKVMNGSEFRLFLIYVERYVRMWRLFDEVDESGEESVEFKDFTDELLSLAGVDQSSFTDADHRQYRGPSNASRESSYGEVILNNGANIQAQRMVRTDEDGQNILYFDRYADLVIRKSLLKEEGDDDFAGCRSRFPHVSFESSAGRRSWKNVVDPNERDPVKDMWTETARKKWARREQLSAEQQQQYGAGNSRSPHPTSNGDSTILSGRQPLTARMQQLQASMNNDRAPSRNVANEHEAAYTFGGSPARKSQAEIIRPASVNSTESTPDLMWNHTNTFQEHRTLRAGYN